MDQEEVASAQLVIIATRQGTWPETALKALGPATAVGRLDTLVVTVTRMTEDFLYLSESYVFVL